MTVSAARRLAFEVLLRVETQGAYADELLHARLSEAKLKREDAALATELVLGALRWQRLLDFLVKRQLNQGPTKGGAARLDAEVRVALRMGLYQLRWLTRVPAPAAVNESVELVKRARKASAAGLVNAVLRKAPREPAAKLVPGDLPLAERLGILHSHPTWLVERWLGAWGEEKTVALLESNNRPARCTCAVHDAAPEKLAEELRRAGLTAWPGRWLATALEISAGNPARTSAFRSGRLAIQDEASQMVSLLLDVAAGQSVLDLCAAPGGKTMAVARAAGPGTLVVAADLHTHRLRAMRERPGFPPWVRVVALDATQPLPFSVRFDRILVDAPCSGTGTLARNPEIRWRIQPDDLADLGRRQQAMLEQAIRHLAPGGRLVYSTCSLEPEENERVVDAVLAANPDIAVLPATKALGGHLRPGAELAQLGDARSFRTFPPEHGTDGFFAAVLEKRGS